MRQLKITILTQLSFFSLLVLITPIVGFNAALPICLLSCALVLFPLRLPVSWLLANCLLVIGLPIIITSPDDPLIGSLLMLTTLILLLLYAPTFWTRVPLFPTEKELYEKAYSVLLKNGQELSFIDLGCGNGGLLVYLAKRMPHGKFIGVEISILPFIISKIRAWGQPNLKIRLTNFWSLDLGSYDYIYAFLSPEPMEKLYQKLCADCPKEGVTFISNSFPLPNIEQTAIIKANKQLLYFYQSPF